MSNKANLIPGAHQLTPEEKSKGGINAAKSRRERKQMSQLARAVLDMPLQNEAVIDAEDLPSLAEIESANVDVKTRIIATLAIKALRGNVKATETLLTLSGDYVTRQEATLEVDSDLRDLDKAQYQIIINRDGAEHRLTYYDDAGNIAKIIYGAEAERLGKLKDEWKEDMRINIIDSDDGHIADTLIVHDMPMHK